MCFSKKQTKQKIRSNKIIPVRVKHDPTKTILDELLFCSGCKKHHRSDEFQLSCNGCDKLFHCKVAGRCQGDNCLIIIGDQEYRYGYCLHCVDQNLPINTTKNGQCLCRICQLV